MVNLAVKLIGMMRLKISAIYFKIKMNKIFSNVFVLKMFLIISLLLNIFGCIHINDKKIVSSSFTVSSIIQNEVTNINEINDSIKKLEESYKTKKLDRYLSLFSTTAVINSSNFSDFKNQIIQIFSQYQITDLNIVPTFINVQLPPILKEAGCGRIKVNLDIKEKDKSIKLKGELVYSTYGYQGILSGIYSIISDSDNKNKTLVNCKFEFSNETAKPKIITFVKYSKRKKNKSILEQIEEISERKVITWLKGIDNNWKIIELKKTSK